MQITQLVDINFDLLSVGIAIAGILLLGCIIFFNNSKSITNQTFFLFSVLTAIWGVSNYFEYRFTTALETLWALRLHLFISTWHALLFFQLAYVFPRDKVSFPRWYRWFLIPAIAITSILTLTPFVFSGIAQLAPAGEVTRGTPAPGIALFILVAFGCLLSGLGMLFVKILKSRNESKKQIIALFIGMFITAILILAFNVVLPNIFSNRSFIPLAALFVLPFIALTSYSIYRFHLFNLKVATTAFLGFMVTVFSFVNVIYSHSASAIVINVTAFIIILGGSIKIVRDTLSLEEANERLEQLTQDLEKANDQQVILIHFITHQLKGFVTKSRNLFSMLLEGDYGKLPSTMTDVVQQGFDSDTKGAETIQEILNAANIKNGKVTYNKQPFDLKALVEEITNDLKPAAEAKHLELKMNLGDSLQFNGDREQLLNALKNLIDNSIKYTRPEALKLIYVQKETKFILRLKTLESVLRKKTWRNSSLRAVMERSLKRLMLRAPALAVYCEEYY